MTNDQLLKNITPISPGKRMELQELAEFIVTHGIIHNNSLMEVMQCRCPELTDEHMRVFMLGIEISIETSLHVYESFTDEGKRVILNAENAFRACSDSECEDHNCDHDATCPFETVQLIESMHESLSSLLVAETPKWLKYAHTMQDHEPEEDN